MTDVKAVLDDGSVSIFRYGSPEAQFFSEVATAVTDLYRRNTLLDEMH
jgi:hypothetical protein